MSETSSETATAQVVRIFHPTIHAPSIPEAEAWFARVFGRSSIPLTFMLPSTPNYPTEYSTFTIIQDVMIDTVDPSQHTVSGVQRYPSVSKPSLKAFGWYVDGMTEFYHKLRHHGIRSMNLWNEVVEGDEPPLSPGGDVIVYFSVREDTGLQYQFMREAPYPIDDRTKGEWTLPPVQPDDALGIERSSHHVILTRNLDRALHFFVTALGGQVVKTAQDDLVGGAATFVSLAGDLFELVVPDAGSGADDAISAAGGEDVYYSIAWKVVDLDRAEKHLRANDISILKQVGQSIMTDAETSFGVPWIFTTSNLAA